MEQSPCYHGMRVVPIRYKPEYHSFELEVLCLTRSNGGAFFARAYYQNMCDPSPSPSNLETHCSPIFFDGASHHDELNMKLHEKIEHLPDPPPTEEQLWATIYESRLEVAVAKARSYANGKVHAFILPDVARTWAIIHAYAKVLQGSPLFTAEQENSLVQEATKVYYQRYLDNRLIELRVAAKSGDVSKVQSVFQEANEAAGHLGYALSSEIKTKQIQEAYQTQLEHLVKEEKESGQSIKELEQRLRRTQEKREKTKEKIGACRRNIYSLRPKKILDSRKP